MITMTNVPDGTPVETPIVAPAGMIASGDIYTFMWMPTARGLDTAGGALGTRAQQAMRTSQSCYMVGVKEKIALRTNDGAPWLWRRICFTYKGDRFLDTADPTESDLFRQTSAGYVRLVNEIPTETWDEFAAAAFRGTQNVDWTDRFTAPLDTSRISVKYDKMTTIRSGNDSGTIRVTARWHGMRKNLVYGDEENGDTVDGFPLSTEGKPGMGDYYIVDMFRCFEGGSHTLSFGPEATLYWHEK